MNISLKVVVTQQADESKRSCKKKQKNNGDSCNDLENPVPIDLNTVSAGSLIFIRKCGFPVVLDHNGRYGVLLRD